MNHNRKPKSLSNAKQNRRLYIVSCNKEFVKILLNYILKFQNSRGLKIDRQTDEQIDRHHDHYKAPI